MQFLITSTQTAMEVDFIHDSILSILYGSVPFFHLAKKYNAKFSNPEETSNTKREVLDDRRMVEGVMLYFLLDIRRRYTIGIIFYHALDATIEKYNDIIMEKFEEVWIQHKCNTPGCNNIMVRTHILKAHIRSIMKFFDFAYIGHRWKHEGHSSSLFCSFCGGETLPTCTCRNCYRVPNDSVNRIKVLQCTQGSHTQSHSFQRKQNRL